MESFRDNKLGSYVIYFVSKDRDIWIHAKDVSLSLGYKYYKEIIHKKASKDNKKKPLCQD